jgi:hypothetical protein
MASPEMGIFLNQKQQEDRRFGACDRETPPTD